MADELGERDARRIACPFCGAGVGVWCTIGRASKLAPGFIHTRRHAPAGGYRRRGRAAPGQLRLF